MHLWLQINVRFQIKLDCITVKSYPRVSITLGWWILLLSVPKLGLTATAIIQINNKITFGPTESRTRLLTLLTNVNVIPLSANTAPAFELKSSHSSGTCTLPLLSYFCSPISGQPPVSPNTDAGNPYTRAQSLPQARQPQPVGSHRTIQSHLNPSSATPVSASTQTDHPNGGVSGRLLDLRRRRSRWKV